MTTSQPFRPDAGAYSALWSVLPPRVQTVLGLCSIPHSLDDELAHRLAQQFGRPNGDAEATVAEVKTLPIVYPYEHGWRVAEGAREVFGQGVAQSPEYAHICGFLTQAFDEAAAGFGEDSARSRELQWKAAFHMAVANPREAMDRLDRFLQFADDEERISDFRAAATLCSNQARWLATVQPDAAYFQGRYAYARGDYSSAAVLLQKVWEAGGRNQRWVEAGHLLAVMLRRSGGTERLAEAERMLRAVLDVAGLLDDEYSGAQVSTTLAATLRDRGGRARLEEAEALASRALGTDVSSETGKAMAAITLGNIIIDRVGRERWSEALALFRRARSFAKGSKRRDLIAGAAVSEALLLRRLGDYPQAEDRLREAITIVPNEPEYKKQLAHVLIQMGEERFGEAESELLRAYRINPQDEAIKVQLRRVRALLTAIKVRQEGRLVAGSSQEWWGLGKAFEHIGDLESAVSCFESAIREGYDRPHVHYRLGTCLARLGRHSEGATSLEKAVAAGVRDRKALAALARTLQKAGRGADAESYFLEAFRKDPSGTDARLRNWYGLWFLEYRRDFESAERYLRAAMELQPSNAMFLNDVARLIVEARKKDKYGEARDLLRRAIELADDELEWPKITLGTLESLEREGEPD